MNSTDAHKVLMLTKDTLDRIARSVERKKQNVKTIQTGGAINPNRSRTSYTPYKRKPPAQSVYDDPGAIKATFTGHTGTYHGIKKIMAFIKLLTDNRKGVKPHGKYSTRFIVTQLQHLYRKHGKDLKAFLQATDMTRKDAIHFLDNIFDEYKKRDNIRSHANLAIYGQLKDANAELSLLAEQQMFLPEQIADAVGKHYINTDGPGPYDKTIPDFQSSPVGSTLSMPAFGSPEETLKSNYCLRSRSGPDLSFNQKGSGGGGGYDNWDPTMPIFKKEWKMIHC